MGKTPSTPTRFTPRAVTIADVAREAGVHPASVSRALRGIEGKVSDETRKRIERVASALGYLPNAVAASLRTKRSNLVGVIVPDLGNPLFGPLVTGIELELRGRGFMCMVAHASEEIAGGDELIAAFAHRQVSGLLILAAAIGDSMLDEVRRYRLPTVLINRGLGNRRFSSVVNDDQESVRLVLDHLLELGHRRIAHVAGPADSSTGRGRRRAFLARCRTLDITAQVVEAAAFTRDGGRVAADHLLAGSFSSTAIFAANDLIALGVIDVLRAHRFKIPADVSVVGHNDMPLMDLIAPPLTTVRIDAEHMGRLGAQMLLARLDDPSSGARTRMLRPELVVRASTAPPRTSSGRPTTLQSTARANSKAAKAGASGR